MNELIVCIHTTKKVPTRPSQELIQLCTLYGMPLLVTMPRSGTTVSKISSLLGPLAIIYSGEKEGCSAALLEAANLRVEIPVTRTAEPSENFRHCGF
jgi:tRNA G18 (ribose-2'-O)-methylase SpoU